MFIFLWSSFRDDFFWRWTHRGHLLQSKLSKLFLDTRLHVVINVLESGLQCVKKLSGGMLLKTKKKMHYVTLLLEPQPLLKSVDVIQTNGGVVLDLHCNRTRTWKSVSDEN